ncbi:MotE family protein [Phenylobacterium sp.]|uniref:MotE family protein n=1 Tax=Phenylobacterium sp. TaxID=1871053 RepID=UPI0035B17123
MSNIPRILPLVGVAMGGVLAINALAGAEGLPDLVSGAKAFAEDAVAKAKSAPAKPAAAAKAAKDDAPADAAATGDAVDAASNSPLPPGAGAASPAAAKPLAPVCAPTAAELAKEAGLSPAELQMLQSLGARRGVLDKREQDLDTQLALLAAAEAKLDAKVKTLNGLKTDIQGLLNQADAREDAELARMVKVFEGMKAKDAAARMAVLEDSVRLPIAAKMKERSLSAVLAAMPASEAKKLTEALAKRYTDAQGLAARAQAAGAAAGVTPGPSASAAPAPAAPAAGPPAKAG